MKDCLPVNLDPLTDVINCSFATSTFPNSCKASEVIPLLKDGDHEKPSNNRPLLMLAVASKICENVAFQQFSNYLQRNGSLANIKVVIENITLQSYIMISDFLSDAMNNKARDCQL